jgi:hypothetical protein
VTATLTPPVTLTGRVRGWADDILATHRTTGVLVGDDLALLRAELDRIPRGCRPHVLSALSGDVLMGADR